jgi:hypothetical protein
MTIRSGRSLTVAATAAAALGALAASAIAAPALAAPALAVGAATPAAKAAVTDPLVGAARLVGTFELAGRITTAVRVTGEHKGQNVIRRWSFLPACSVGSCRTIGLLRVRSGGSDKVKLTRKRPGYYTGSGSFYAPLKCGGKTYGRGEAVPFTVTVTITGALRDATGALVATRVNATYTNKSRRNLTRCVDFPGHDAASYHGHVLLGSSSGGTGVANGA